MKNEVGVKIIETTVYTKVYMVNGIEFETKEEAEVYLSHLEQALNYTYFTVKYEVDEDAVFHKSMKVAAPADFFEESVVLQFCINHLGNPLIKKRNLYLPKFEIVNEGKFESLETIKDFEDHINTEETSYSDFIETNKKGSRIIYLNNRGSVDVELLKVTSELENES